VGDLGGFVSIGMQVIAREFRAIKAEIDAFGLDTLINPTGLSHIESGYGAALTTASFTDCLFEGYIPFLRDLFSNLRILASEIHGTVPTIKSTGRSQMLKIH
jgi:hypothetical protein